MWCVGLFNSVYVQWNLYYNCKFNKFDTKLNVQIPVKSVHGNRNRNSGRSMVTKHFKIVKYLADRFVGQHYL